MMDLVHTWYDDRYKFRVLFNDTLAHAHGQAHRLILKKFGVLDSYFIHVHRNIIIK